MAQPATGGTEDPTGLADDIARLRLSQPRRQLRYLLCMDIEATCSADERFSNDTHEVIELPCVLVDIEDDCKIVDEFHTFVKPSKDNKELTAYCQQLTGITQDQVDAAPTFREALTMLDAFLDKHSDKLFPHPQVGTKHSKPRNYAWVTHGTADIERFLAKRSCRINNIRLPPYWQGGYIDLRLLFTRQFPNATTSSIVAMLAQWQLEFKGKQHSGLEDARNIARVMAKMIMVEKVDLKCNRSIVMDSSFRFSSRKL